MTETAAVPTSLAAAYPCAVAGVDLLRAHIAATAEERAAWLLSVDEHEMTELYLQSVDLFRALQEHIFPAIDRAVRDRWLSNGDDRFEKAVRAHAREHQLSREALAEAQRQCPATMPTAQFFKQQKHFEATAEYAERMFLAKFEETEAQRAEAKALVETLMARLDDGVIIPPGVDPTNPRKGR